MTTPQFGEGAFFKFPLSDGGFAPLMIGDDGSHWCGASLLSPELAARAVERKEQVTDQEWLDLLREWKARKETLRAAKRPLWRRMLKRVLCWEVFENGYWWRLFWVIGFAAHRIDPEHRQPLFSERYGYGTFLCWRGRWLVRPLRSGWAPK